ATFAMPTMLGAQTAFVDGGKTSVLLDTALLSAAASLDLSSVSSDVNEGNLGTGSVAFDINGRDAASLPTTFSYTPGSLAPFFGAIEHTGSVFFNNDTVEVGNFTIGFDANRVSGNTSGFFVESTTGINAVLFDVGTPSLLDASANSLGIQADLLVSNEFSDFLNTNGLASSDLTGADVGNASVKASAIPEPCGTFIIVCVGGLAAVRRKR
ncbi:MAG: hypothetical protein AAGA30_19325, partial [Planctomycetota bacterium]